jgi:hypothetical protein
VPTAADATAATATAATASYTDNSTGDEGRHGSETVPPPTTVIKKAGKKKASAALAPSTTVSAPATAATAAAANAKRCHAVVGSDETSDDVAVTLAHGDAPPTATTCSGDAQSSHKNLASTTASTTANTAAESSALRSANDTRSGASTPMQEEDDAPPSGESHFYCVTILLCYCAHVLIRALSSSARRRCASDIDCNVHQELTHLVYDVTATL